METVNIFLIIVFYYEVYGIGQTVSIALVQEVKLIYPLKFAQISITKMDKTNNVHYCILHIRPPNYSETYSLPKWNKLEKIPVKGMLIVLIVPTVTEIKEHCVSAWTYFYLKLSYRVATVNNLISASAVKSLLGTSKQSDSRWPIYSWQWLQWVF